jgi:hypothetical protein
MASTSETWTADAEVFRSCAGTRYDSWHYHRGGGAPDKAVWCVPSQAEADLFCDAEAGQWRDSAGDLWGVTQQAAESLGSRGERYAHFRQPSAPAAGWHGFPVTNNPRLVGRGRVREIPNEALLRWEETGRIDFVVRTRIARGKL